WVAAGNGLPAGAAFRASVVLAPASCAAVPRVLPRPRATALARPLRRPLLRLERCERNAPEHEVVERAVQLRPGEPDPEPGRHEALELVGLQGPARSGARGLPRVAELERASRHEHAAG